MIDAQAMFRRVQRWRCPDLEAALLAREPAPDAVAAGSFGRMCFIITADSDGHIEASVSSRNGRATDAHVEALCRYLNITPPRRAQRINGGGLMWVIVQGVRQ